MEPVATAETSVTSQTTAALSHREIMIVFGAVLTGMFLSALDQTIVGTALPRIVSELHGFQLTRGSPRPTC